MKVGSENAKRLCGKRLGDGQACIIVGNGAVADRRLAALVGGVYAVLALRISSLSRKLKPNELLAVTTLWVN